MHRIIDIDHWERKELFTFFQKYDDPTWDILAEVDVAGFYKTLKETDASFFLSFLFFPVLNNDITMSFSE